MVVGTINDVRIDNALEVILESLLGKESIESKMYGKGASKEKIAEVLAALKKNGFVDSYMRAKGQKVPVYTLSEKGVVLFCVNRLRNEVLATEGELDLDEMLCEGVTGALKDRYAAQPSDEDD